ncbi:MAG: hypothetical protein JXR03_14740 [Cyclobacteriaceae bacterium]
MTTNNTFNLSRFIELIKQNVLINFSLILKAVIGFIFGLCLILLIIQRANRFHGLSEDNVFPFFIVAFFLLGILIAGTSFPGLRSKEKAFGYIMLPTTVLEKFVFEFSARVGLYVLMFPLLFSIIYGIEGSIVASFYPDYSQVSVLDEASKIFGIISRQESVGWIYLLTISLIFLPLITSLTGTTFFTKHPLLKTLFSVTILIFFHFALLYFFAEFLGWKKYNLPDDGSWVLPKRKGDPPYAAFAILASLANLVLLLVSYFKLKEREV